MVYRSPFTLQHSTLERFYVFYDFYAFYDLIDLNGFNDLNGLNGFHRSWFTAYRLSNDK